MGVRPWGLREYKRELGVRLRVAGSGGHGRDRGWAALDWVGRDCSGSGKAALELVRNKRLLRRRQSGGRVSGSGCCCIGLGWYEGVQAHGRSPSPFLLVLPGHSPQDVAPGGIEAEPEPQPVPSQWGPQ